jgi:hypothetical protein
LEESFFEGLRGQYSFELGFVLKEEGEVCESHTICVRIAPQYSRLRSVSADIDMPAGRFVVLPMIRATRDLERPTIEETVKKYVELNRKNFGKLA